MICCYPVERRRARVAANLVLDVLHHTTQELHHRRHSHGIDEGGRAWLFSTKPDGDGEASALDGQASEPVAPPRPVPVEAVVLEGVSAGVIAERDADLILRTRVDGIRLRLIARTLGVNYEALLKRRQRAEAALRSLLASRSTHPRSTTASAPAQTATVPGVQVGPTVPAISNQSSGTTTSVGGDQASHPHFWDLPGRIRQSINDWFQGLVVDALTPMLDLVGKTVLATPQLAADAQVGQLWKLSLLSADALLVLFVLVAAGLAMSHDTMQTRYALKDLIVPAAFAGIAINASLALSGQMITLANALAAGFLGQGASTAGGASSLQTFIVGALAGGGIFITLLGLGCAVVAVWLPANVELEDRLAFA